MGRQAGGAGTAAASTVGGRGRFRLGVLGRVVVVVSIVVAACSDSEPRRRPDASQPEAAAATSGAQPEAAAATSGAQPEAAAATSGAQPGPKVSDLGPGWAEAFVGKYVRQSREVGLYWSIPRWGLDRDHRILGHPAMAGEHFLEFLDRSGTVLESVELPMRYLQFPPQQGVPFPEGEANHIWSHPIVDPPFYAGYRIIASERVLQDPGYVVPTLEEDAAQTAETGRGGARSPEVQDPAGDDEQPNGRRFVTILQVQGSANRPEVWLERPGPGQTVANDHVEIAWRASDPDCDTLRHELSYSVDGGQTYKLVPEAAIPSDARNYKPRSHTLHRARLESSEQVHLAIVVSDGTRWAAARSTFTWARPQTATSATSTPAPESPLPRDTEGYERAVAGLCF